MTSSLHWHEILLQNRRDSGSRSSGNGAFECVDGLQGANENFDMLRGSMLDEGQYGKEQS